MPKITSYAQAGDKENEAPTMANYVRRRERSIDDDEDVHEQVDRFVGGSHARATGRSRQPKQRDELSSSTKAFEKTVTGAVRDSEGQRKARKLASTEEDIHVVGESRAKVAVLNSLPKRKGDERAHTGRDELQSQFDTLRDLRMTEPERQLMEWKRDAESKDKRAGELIATLEKDLREARRDPTTSRDAMSSENETELRKQLEEARRREEKLKNENTRLAREIERIRSQTVVASSNAFRSGTSSGQSNSSDERAVRRLYEDLTGIVLNNVETLDGPDGFRRFHAIFAGTGYYDLEIKLEESSSELPSIVPSATSASGLREDLVYTPAFDEDRDADLLQSGRLPSFLKDSIRFERATAVKFMATLHKKLDRNAKR